MSSPKQNQELLLIVLKRDGQFCHWCDHPIRTHRQLRGLVESNKSTYGYREATLDHVIPRSEGGTDELTNLVPACAICNVERSRARMSGASPKIDKKKQVEVDHARYVEQISWHIPPEIPSSSGLYLVVKPSTFRLHLVAVHVNSQGETFILQGDRVVPWEKFWFFPLDSLLNVSLEPQRRKILSLAFPKPSKSGA
jgi:hypothetical protein